MGCNNRRHEMRDHESTKLYQSQTTNKIHWHANIQEIKTEMQELRNLIRSRAEYPRGNHNPMEKSIINSTETLIDYKSKYRVEQLKVEDVQILKQENNSVETQTLDDDRRSDIERKQSYTTMQRLIQHIQGLRSGQKTQIMY